MPPPPRTKQVTLLARALEANDTLVFLGLANNSLGSVGVAAVSEMLKVRTCEVPHPKPTRHLSSCVPNEVIFVLHAVQHFASGA